MDILPLHRSIRKMYRWKPGNFCRPAEACGACQCECQCGSVSVPVPVKKTEKRTIFAEKFRGGGIQSRIRNTSDSDLRRRHADTPTRRHADTPTRRHADTPTRPHAHTPTRPTRPHAHTPTRRQAHTPTRPHAHTPTRPHAHTPTRPHAHTPTRPHAHTPTRPHAHTPTRRPPCPDLPVLQLLNSFPNGPSETNCVAPSSCRMFYPQEMLTLLSERPFQ